MSIEVAYRDENEWGEVLLEGSLVLPAMEMTVLELLLRRINDDIRRHALSWDEPYRGLVQPLLVEETGNEIVLSMPSPCSATLVDAAINALQAGQLQIAYGARTLDSATATLTPAGRDSLLFVKRAPLIAA